jgi:Fe-S-cluster containining protein
VARFDCQTCGACCHNTAENMAAGRREYVEVAKTDALFRERRDVLRQVATRNEDGVYHLRLVGDDQRCVALTGSGSNVACAIYSLRPRGCRRVTAGDGECLRARARVGLSV